MRPRKLHSPVTLFAAIEESQYEAIRNLAFRQRQSIADIVRKALDDYLEGKRAKTRATAKLPARQPVSSS